MAVAQKNKPRLGRGLSSLISGSQTPVEVDVSARSHSNHPAAAHLPDGNPLMISIDAVRPNPHQPRKTIKESAIAELAVSLKSTGMIQPVIVKKVDDGFELIAGERRWLAAKLAGLTDIPAIVRQVDSFAQAQMALVENIQREDLNAIERAQAYKQLMEQLGLTQAELAGRMGEERSSVANFLRLLDLGESVRNYVRDGRLSLGHAKLLAGIPDILRQSQLAERVVADGLSVRSLEKLIQEQPAPPLTKAAATPSAHLADLEKSLTRQLGLRVQLRSAAKGKGRLILHYGSLDQFDDLLEKLGAKAE
jgi:ParB family chromosome partitioning protein